MPTPRAKTAQKSFARSSGAYAPPRSRLSWRSAYEGQSRFSAGALRPLALAALLSPQSLLAASLLVGVISAFGRLCEAAVDAAEAGREVSFAADALRGAPEGHWEAPP